MSRTNTLATIVFLLAPTAAHADVIAISEARDLAAGAAVTIQGRVTVPSGTFASAIGDEGFAVNDRTGGIFVCTHDTNYNLRNRRAVEIQGTMDDTHGMPCVLATRVDQIGRRDLRLPTGNVPTSAVGSIVTVQGEIVRVEADEQYGTKVFIDDGTGEREIFIGTKIAQPRWIREGTKIRATGFVAQFPGFNETTPEIDIRSRRDIRRVR